MRLRLIIVFKTKLYYSADKHATQAMNLCQETIRNGFYRHLTKNNIINFAVQPKSSNFAPTFRSQSCVSDDGITLRNVI